MSLICMIGVVFGFSVIVLGLAGISTRGFCGRFKPPKVPALPPMPKIIE